MAYRGVEEIAEEVYRRGSARLDELHAANQRMRAANRALTEQTAAEMRRVAEQEKREAEGSPDEKSAVVGDERPAEPEPPRPGVEGPFDQRDAVARSVAARRARNVVTPVDDDGDDEAEYYRRKSWLV